MGESFQIAELGSRSHIFASRSKEKEDSCIGENPGKNKVEGEVERKEAGAKSVERDLRAARGG